MPPLRFSLRIAGPGHQHRAPSIHGALQTGNNTGNIAATWYNQTGFYMDLNLTDATPHQIAVYLLDWDFQGRSETVRIVDPTTNTQLDSKTISGFANGIYLIWNISGHVHINITTNSGPNSVASGIFFATTSGVNVKPGTINLSAAKRQFTASVPSATNQNVTWSMTPSVGTISSSGLYTAPATISAAQTITVTATSAADTTKFSSAMVGLVPGSAVANFVSFDTATKGNWSSLYGADGYSLANANQKLPSYGSSTTVQNQLDWVWASSTTDPRGLEIPGGASALAATWYNPGSFNFDVNLTDGHSHQVAFYAVDWDSTSRSETVQILDATTNAVLDTETIAKFSGGVYAIWNISGHVKVVVSDASYPNSVISGVFFGGRSTGSSTSSASTTSSGTSNVLPVVPPPTTSGSTSGSTSSTTSSTTSTSSGSTTTVPPAVGTLTANASSISFGSINIGSSSAKTISVSNTGSANVTISTDSISGSGLNASGASGVVLHARSKHDAQRDLHACVRGQRLWKPNDREQCIEFVSVDCFFRYRRPAAAYHLLSGLDVEHQQLHGYRRIQCVPQFRAGRRVHAAHIFAACWHHLYRYDCTGWTNLLLCGDFSEFEQRSKQLLERGQRQRSVGTAFQIRKGWLAHNKNGAKAPFLLFKASLKCKKLLLVS